MEDDRSAITFWLPKSAQRRDEMAGAFEAIARIFRGAADVETVTKLEPPESDAQRLRIPEQPKLLSLVLADLKEKRAAMDRAPWSFHAPDPRAASVHIQGAECRCDEADDTTDLPTAVRCPQHEQVAQQVTLVNAVGIAATHNAADTLIEIVEIALAWRLALDERDNFEARTCRDARVTMAEYLAGSAKLNKKVDACVTALREVLTKPSP